MLAANRPLRLAIYAMLAAILYLPGLGRPALWEPDEGRYAEIAREMVVSGDYVTPRDDFELYFEKPPLVYWADAASIGVFGANEFAVRLPAALVQRRAGRRHGRVGRGDVRRDGRILRRARTRAESAVFRLRAIRDARPRAGIFSDRGARRVLRRFA